MQEYCVNSVRLALWSVRRAIDHYIKILVCYVFGFLCAPVQVIEQSVVLSTLNAEGKYSNSACLISSFSVNTWVRN